MATDNLALIRLLQLTSPSLPIGGYSYSQGIEWAVEAGWICNADDLTAWLGDQLDNTLGCLEIPLLTRMCKACRADDAAQLAAWCDELLAWRETAELRTEERNRGRALAELLIALKVPGAAAHRSILTQTQLAGLAHAAEHWGITTEQLALGYAWSWLENLVLAGVKLVPLGQTDGQRVLLRLGERLPEIVAHGLALPDTAIGASLPALAIASSAHETQYTRLFRS